MKLYEINAALEALLERICDIEDQIVDMMRNVNKATGELECDQEELSALSAEHDRLMAELENIGIVREEKLEGLALSTKNDRAEAEAIYTEIDNLSKRARSLKNRAERKSEFLERMLNGEKFQTPRVAITYRTSQAVELGPEFLPWALEKDAYLRYKDPEPDKAMLKTALKAGEQIPGAELVTRQSMTIK